VNVAKKTKQTAKQLSDFELLSKIRKTTDPLELLSWYVVCHHMLGGDSYYKDFQTALLKQAELLTAKKPRKGAL
jgi:hypothetical protein